MKGWLWGRQCSNQPVSRFDHFGIENLGVGKVQAIGEGIGGQDWRIFACPVLLLFAC
ncbi:hypothetical protein NA78x_005446 [Anatilimnocola sp. NA78]|uniref:hypothetical protein n=1 Tax=Anatilimnocola sp. NA78 TaxID=3415683 RepID=UPI003CE5815E